MSAALPGGRVLASTSAVLLGLAAWLAWPNDGRAASTPADVSEPRTRGPTSSIGAPFATASASAITAPGSLRDAAPRRDLVVHMRPAAGTPHFGIVRLLRRPAFAPDVRFDAELWQVFAGGPRGDLIELAASVFDRLARLGYEQVVEHPWARASDTGALTVSFATEIVRDAEVAVGLSAHAVGYLALPADAAGREPELTLFGVGEIALADGHDGAWAWSESSFPGPHRAGPGCPVPAAITRVLRVGRTPLALRYHDPVDLVAGGVATPGWSSRTRTRVLRVAGDVSVDGALVHLLRENVPPEPRYGLPLAPMCVAGAFMVREEGEPFGVFVRLLATGATQAIGIERP